MLLARGIGVVCQAVMALEPRLWSTTWVMVPIILFRVGALSVGRSVERAVPPVSGRVFAWSV